METLLCKIEISKNVVYRLTPSLYVFVEQLFLQPTYAVIYSSPRIKS